MKIKKYQVGGNAPMPAEAPAQQGGDPLMQIAQIFMEGLQSGDCNLLAQGAEAFLGLLQQAAGPAPVDQAPQGQPVFKKGGKVCGRKQKK